MAPKRAPQGAVTRSDRRREAVQRRRRQASARSAAARRAASRRRWLRGSVAAAVVAVAAGTLWLLVGRGDGGPSKALRAERVEGAEGPLGITSVPESYRAVYRVEAFQGSDVTESTEEIKVRRPFDGRVFIREGPPPGAAVQFEGRSTFGLYANYTESGPAEVAGDAPTVALGDLRLERILDELVAQELFVPGDRRRTLGRECQEYRTGSPVQSLRVTAPTEEDYADVCIDANGLLLEEVTVAGGELTQRLTATELETGVALDPADFTIEGERLTAEQGGATVTEVDRTVAPTAGYWTLESLPAGFTHRGRYLVEGEGSSHVDVYVGGADLVTVRQGAPAAEPDLRDAGTGRDVDLGEVGQGQTFLRTIGPIVVAHPGSEAFVHVAGTLSSANLEGLARSLRQR
jgi:hypothetical protein